MRDGEIEVRVQSGYGGNTERGFVSLAFGDRKPDMMSPAKAREIAGLLLECAEAADQDHFLMSFFQREVGLDLDKAARLLVQFRLFRGELRTEGE